MTSDYKPWFPTNTEGLETIAEGLLMMPPPPGITLGTGVVTLDAAAAGSGKKKTQNQWIKYWNKITDGRLFASAANHYAAFKQLSAAEKTGTAQQKAAAHTLAESLRKDCKESWIITSTRIIYHPPSLDAEIIHHYGNKNPALQTKKKLDVPEWSGVPIRDALQDRKCLPYLQVVFGTTDNQETIVSTLEYVSGVPRSTIKLWTPPFKHDTYWTREQHKERAVRFDLDSGGFHVNGNGHVDYGSGRSRGVLL